MSTDGWVQWERLAASNSDHLWSMWSHVFVTLTSTQTALHFLKYINQQGDSVSLILPFPSQSCLDHPQVFMLHRSLWICLVSYQPLLSQNFPGLMLLMTGWPWTTQTTYTIFTHPDTCTLEICFMMKWCVYFSYMLKWYVSFLCCPPKIIFSTNK